MFRQAIVLSLALVFTTLSLMAFDTATAGPPALAPTEEPTKRPYVFPTPIFIPTYPTEIASATAIPVRTTGNSAGPASSQLVGAQSYTVQSGDNPWTIAQKVCGNGTKGTVILAENGIADPTKLRVGTVLKIPPGCAASVSVQTTMATPQAPQLPVATPMNVSDMPATTPVAITRTEQPASGGEMNLMWQLGMLAVNVGSGLLMLGSIISGGSAWMVYRRTRFLRAVTVRVQRLRSRHR